MRARLRRLAAIAAATAAATGTGTGVIPAAGGAEHGRAHELRVERQSLERRASSALLELYALESRLATAHAELEAAKRREADLERELGRAADGLEAARRGLAAAELALAERLRAVYELGDVHPLAVLLGAESVDDAITGLDGLRYAAEHDVQVVARARAARAALEASRHSLSERRLQAAAATRVAAHRTAELQAAREVRLAYLARLAAEQRLSTNRLAALERRARAAQERARALSPAPAPILLADEAVADDVPADGSRRAETGGEGEVGAGEGPTARSARTLTVTATGYALRGTTATGIPAGHGVVAVDPSVIPLGARLYVPGYGEAVAADVGRAVRGNKIDLWFPTRAEALAWGRRTISITVY